MSSTVGKIHGQVLENNLLRNGVDLAFDTDLIYLDVNNGRIGINTDTPFRPLLVNGTLSSTNVLVDTGTISNFSFALNTITNNVNSILISASGAGATITAGGIATDGISIDANGIRALRSNEDIDLVPAGSGQITILTSTEVNGSVHVTGNVTFDGNIVFGNNDLDSVSLIADINSNIDPDQTNTYDLGAPTKRWQDLHTNSLTGIAATSGSAFVNGIDLGLKQGNTWYVATNGSYDNVGDHPNGPFDTIEKALSVAVAGDTVLIYPGTYYELLPLTVPAGVSVKGAGIRSVIIKPDTASTAENVFLLNGETTVEDLTVSDFFYDSINDTGYAFSFAPGFTVTSRSPYVRNITVITTGSITSGTDPRGFAAGDAGKGVKVDGSLALAGSNEASMLFHSCTFITPGVDAITMTNGVRVEWLNCFTYFALRGLYATNGSLGFASLAEYQLSVEGVATQTIQSGDTITVPLISSGTRTLTVESVGYSGSTANIVVTGNIANIQTYITPPPNISVTYNITNLSQVFTDQFGSGNPVGRLGGKFTSGNTFNEAIWNDLVPLGSRVIVKWNNVANEVDMGIVTQVDKATYSFDNNYVYVTNPTNFVLPVVNGYFPVDARATYFRIENNTITASGGQTGLYISSITTLSGKFGAEVRAIGSASVYGTYGAVADGADTLMYLISHNFGYVGTDGDSSNDPSLVIESNQAVELNSGVIYYDSVDHKGDFKVGDIFKVEQSTGKIIFQSVQLNNTSLVLTNGPDTTYIDAFEVTTGNITVSGNTIQSNTGGITLTAANTDLDVTSNLTVNQTLTVDQLATLNKDLIIGNSFTDTVYFNSRVNSNIIPKTNNLDLGINTNRWKTLYAAQATFDDILINTNFISTTLSNSNLDLAATGAGVIRFEALDVSSNVISSTSTNADININPNGTGKIQLLKDTDITGNLSVTGNINVGGNIQLGDVIIDSIDPVGKIGSNLMPNITGSYDIGSLTKTWRNLFMSNLVTDDMEINDNYIRTTASNSDLELRANGTGIINITDSASVVQNLTVNGLTNLKNTSIDGLLTSSVGLLITNNISASTFITDDIIFDENYFTTTLSNSNLELRANGTGNVLFDNVLQITGSTISNSLASGTEANRSIIFNPVSGKNVAIQSTKALQLPIGNNTDRTLTTNGEIRYNNTSSTFEGKISGRNISLYNLFDTDGNTGISPELTPGANDNTIRMYANGVLSASITAQAATFNRITVDEIDINNNVIGTLNTNADLELERSGTGVINIKDSFNITDNIITNTTSGAVTQIVTTTTGYVKFVGTGALRIPHGLTSEQPLTAPVGATRYNTTTKIQEVYDGTSWIAAGGAAGATITAEEMELIGDLYSLIFG